jgi:hypothetical protein
VTSSAVSKPTFTVSSAAIGSQPAS